jgi:hypothetical protein
MLKISLLLLAALKLLELRFERRPLIHLQYLVCGKLSVR